MLEKTIKQVLKKRVNEWIDSVEDLNIKALIRKNVIITGGCIPSMMLNEDVNGFDVYFKTKESAMEVAKYYADLWMGSRDDSRLIEVMEIENNRIKIFIKSDGVEGNPEEANSCEELAVNRYFGKK